MSRILVAMTLWSLAVGTAAAYESARTKQDPELWNALTRIQHRFNVAAVGAAGTWEGVSLGAVGLGAGTASRLGLHQVGMPRFRSLAVPFGFAGAIVYGVGQYVQARDRRSDFDPRDLPRVLGENQTEAEELWQVFHFVKLRIEDQYAFAISDLDLRAWVLDLDRWLREELGQLAPPTPPARVTK